MKETPQVEKLQSEIEKIEELRSRLKIFWENVLGDYYEKHREYPPFISGRNVSHFIQLVSNRDAHFRQSIEQFRPLQNDIERIAMEVYDRLAKAKK